MPGCGTRTRIFNYEGAQQRGDGDARVRCPVALAKRVREQDGGRKTEDSGAESEFFNREGREGARRRRTELGPGHRSL
jgi:hypothetical protein